MSRRLLLLTGVSSGVGLSLARHLSARFHVIGLARDLVAARNALDGTDNLSLVRAELADPESVAACLGLVIERYGIPNYLINNAGVNIHAHLDLLTERDLLESLQVNCLAPMTLMQRLLPAMVSNGFGRIVNITSGAPMNCFPGFAAYSASKGALNAVTVTAAREYAAHDIRINLMSPGPVRSNMAPTAPMDPSVCHGTVDYLLDLPADGPTGRFFWLGRELPLFPDLSGVQWLEGTASARFRRVL